MMKLNPSAASIIVISHSIILFLFASQGISSFLSSVNLPSIPLVPVSSSQAIVGAVLGIGLLKGGQELKWDIIRKISFGWVLSPIIAVFFSITILFILENIFGQSVSSNY